jgi:hypothetical protein
LISPLFGRWQGLFTVVLHFDEIILKWAMIVGGDVRKAQVFQMIQRTSNANGGREPNGAEYLDPKA